MILYELRAQEINPTIGMRRRLLLSRTLDRIGQDMQLIRRAYAVLLMLL